jgi:hypothetical protein
MVRSADAVRAGWRARLAGDRPPYGLILAGYAVIVVVLTIAVTITSKAPEYPSVQTGPAWLDSWFHFDSVWYYTIATGGYSFTPGAESSIAFFPTYPMAVRGLGALIGDAQIAGTLISVTCGAAAMCLFARWVWPRLSRRAAVIAVALMMVFPYAFFFYGPMYSDPVFLLVVLGAFTLLERRMYWTAGLVGVLATAGRPVGLAITVGLVVRMLEMQAEVRTKRTSAAAPTDPSPGLTTAVSPHPTVGPHPTFREIVAAVPTVRWRQLGVLISGFGLVGWCVYLWLTFGNPLIWIQAQEAWGQASGPATWFKLTYVDTVLHGYKLKALSLTAQLVLCVLAVATLPLVRRFFGWGYCAYAIVVLAIPLIGTKDFYGTGRYIMVAFPVMAVAAAVIADSHRRWLAPTAFAISIFGLIGAAVLYAMVLPVS